MENPDIAEPIIELIEILEKIESNGSGSNVNQFNISDNNGELIEL